MLLLKGFFYLSGSRLASRWLKEERKPVWRGGGIKERGVSPSRALSALVEIRIISSFFEPDLRLLRLPDYHPG
jgi:hypothetical protein